MNRPLVIRPFELAYASCVWLLLLVLTGDAATRTPFSVPLRFGSDKSVDFVVDIARHRYYQIDLVFPFKGEEQRPAVMKLAGEPTGICKSLNECGVTPSFLVTIRRGGDVVLREEKTPVGIYAHGSNEFCRMIVTTPLKPAHYDITVEVISSPAELAGYGALIQFTTYPKASDLKN
jgi:hypothetical protein